MKKYYDKLAAAQDILGLLVDEAEELDDDYLNGKTPIEWAVWKLNDGIEPYDWDLNDSELPPVHDIDFSIGVYLGVIPEQWVNYSVYPR